MKYTMDQLLKELKEEHKQLSDLFEKIDKEGISKKLVLQLKDAAINHLKREDEQLYPVLQKSMNEEVKQVGMIFSDLMKGYSQKFIEVVEKIVATDGNVDKQTIDDFNQVKIKIKDRMTVEETMLFVAYTKCL